MSDEIILMIMAYLFMGCIEAAASFEDACRLLRVDSSCIEIILWFALMLLWLPIGVIVIATDIIVESTYRVINYFKRVSEVDAHGFEKENY